MVPHVICQKPHGALPPIANAVPVHLDRLAVAANAPTANALNRRLCRTGESRGMDSSTARRSSPGPAPGSARMRALWC